MVSSVTNTWSPVITYRPVRSRQPVEPMMEPSPPSSSVARPLVDDAESLEMSVSSTHTVSTMAVSGTGSSSS